MILWVTRIAILATIAIMPTQLHAAAAAGAGYEAVPTGASGSSGASSKDTPLMAAAAGARTDSYTLPKDISDRLQASSVVVFCGSTLGSAIAISDRYFLTAAHNVLPSTKGETVYIMAPNDKRRLKTLNVHTAGYVDMTPTDTLHPVKVKKVHFLDSTKFGKPTEDKAVSIDLEKLKEETRRTLDVCSKDAIAFAEEGISQPWVQYPPRGKLKQELGALWGPDIAIIACEEAHGLPFLPIASNDTPEAILFIGGVAGKRYLKKDHKLCKGGVIPDPKYGLFQDAGKYQYGIKPEVYAQRFSSLAASKEDPAQRLWINKIPLKSSLIGLPLFEDEFPLDDAPEGFGIISNGDSGAGAVLLQDGSPYLAGIVSRGDIPRFPRAINNVLLPMLEAETVDETAVACLQVVNQPWFVIQALVDIRHLAPLINAIVATNK